MNFTFHSWAVRSLDIVDLFQALETTRSDSGSTLVLIREEVVRRDDVSVVAHEVVVGSPRGAGVHT